MIKKEKEVADKTEIEAIIQDSLVCRLGLTDNNRPYVVPLCFGYQDNAVYVHGSSKGMKNDILKKNQNVCFECDTGLEMVEEENACKWSLKYRSVIGFGQASFIEDLEEKKKALAIVMKHYSDRPFQFPDQIVNKTTVIKIDITSMTGKKSGYK